MSHLIDIDVIIDALNNQQHALALLATLAAAPLHISVLTLGELLEGVYAHPNPEPHMAGIQQFLQGYRVLGVTDAVMHVFARERARLRRAGQLIPDFDLAIASTAISHQLTLVSRNRDHFERVQGLSFQAVEVN